MTERGRMEEFEDTSRAFDFSLLRADWHKAADFINAPELKANINFESFKKIKVVDCRPTRIIASEDKNSVKREVDLQYFLVDRNILRTIPYVQQWEYLETGKGWMLKSGLPVFEP
jgi:hypothetical protein